MTSSAYFESEDEEEDDEVALSAVPSALGISTSCNKTFDSAVWRYMINLELERFWRENNNKSLNSIMVMVSRG